MQNWLLKNISDVLNSNQEMVPDVSIDNSATTVLPQTEENRRLATLKAQQEWFGAIAALEKLLLSTVEITPDKSLQGLVFSAPVPILSNLDLLARFQAGIFTTDAFKPHVLMPCDRTHAPENEQDNHDSSILQLPLVPYDPIAKEQFCLVFTQKFALVMVLGQDALGMPNFNFSFDPETIKLVWLTLRSRLYLLKYERLAQIDQLIEHFSPQLPDYRLISQFTRNLLQNLPNLTALAIGNTCKIETIAVSQSEPEKAETTPDYVSPIVNASPSGKLEMELLQALTHEIRTPLTTIRTMTRLLLKKSQDFSTKAISRLQTIDRECTEQIERMELIFRATELESTSAASYPVHLTSCCLATVLRANIPRWEQQAQRRNVNLEIVLPQKLPPIISDPAMLDRVLTGLIETCTRSLSHGGNLRLIISTAGDRLKLQVLSHCNHTSNPFKALGQLLMFQPETGCLSLNLDATKNMFQALGGKLTVRQKSRQSEELTIFLPLGTQSVNS
ncbi:signal transduction histidine kinase [Xenococcus sp. PCC 7305]|uniref:sensor histidine kinase n=1 Tax=Xenococcus sp. PCC 7305 TaxID=102125 RepID=UPI0002AC275E|nr:HAMP domain-containing sensor histidine kinase [Xenococcus sp. PCC 7305]ELS04954.1 signal transduction histidine kinase [Xenococcus sp. PCC 7305]